MWDTINSGEIWNGEIMNKRRNGEFYWEAVIISPVFNDENKIVNFLAIKEDITKNRELANQVEEQNLNYKKLLENLPNIVLIHIKGKIIFANNFALKEIGLSESEFLEHSIMEFIHPDCREKVIENLKRRESGQKVENYEIKIIVQNQIKNVFMYIDDTDFQGEKATMVILIDITERKKYELELIESEEKFRVLSESTPFGILMYRDDKWIYCNPAAEKITGYFAGELKKMIAWDIIADEFRDMVSYRATQRLKGKEVASTYEIKIKSKHSGEKWCLITAVVINYNGLPTGLVSVADISNLKTIETKLKFSEEKYRNLAENTSDVTWTLDKNRVITYISPADKKMRGFENKDVIGKKLDIFIKNGINNNALSIIPEYDTDDEIIIPEGICESDLLCADGSYIWTECSVSDVFYENGEFIGYQGITRNISSRKLAEDALKRSDKLKTEFLNNISHEIRTPLNGILGFASLTLNMDASDHLKEKYFDIMKQSSSRLIKTIDDYMDISLLISKSMKYSESTFDLIKTLNRVHTELFSTFIKKQIDFKISYPECYTNYYIVCDEGLIEKIIKQLLSNSLKFTENGIVNFGFEEIGGSTRLFVNDSGPGMSQEALAHATDFFYKNDFVKDKTNDGSGLGLSIVKGIVDMLNGDLELKTIIILVSKYLFCLN
jgi:PAS domain S-box-containing protein